MMADEELFAAAFERGREEMREMLQERGGTITAEEVAERLHITAEEVERRRDADRLLGVVDLEGEWRYPVWQFTSSGMLDGFELVLAELWEEDPWMRMIFLLGSSPRLRGRVPIEVLQEGDIDAVLIAAECFGEPGA